MNVRKSFSNFSKRGEKIKDNKFLFFSQRGNVRKTLFFRMDVELKNQNSLHNQPKNFLYFTILSKINSTN